MAVGGRLVKIAYYQWYILGLIAQSYGMQY